MSTKQIRPAAPFFKKILQDPEVCKYTTAHTASSDIAIEAHSARIKETLALAELLAIGRREAEAGLSLPAADVFKGLKKTNRRR